MINKNQRCKMITLLKSLKNINILIVPTLMILIKWPFYMIGFCLSCMGSGYCPFYTNYICIMIFSTFSSLMLLRIDKK